MNLPNKLTMARVVMIPVFVVLFLLKDRSAVLVIAAIAVFVAASLTDMLDGKIARKRNLVTNFGKFADPLADKLLVCSALICLLYFHLIPVWAGIVIVAREFIISGFRLVAAEKGVVLAASMTAKVKTTVQMIMTISLMVTEFVRMLPALPVFHVILTVLSVLNWILIIAAVILTVVSLAEYLVKNWGVMEGEM